MPAQPTPRTMLRATRLAVLAVAALVAALLAAPVVFAATANYKGSSADGKVVFFETEEQLVPGDTDTKRDVYERSYDEGVGAYVTREVSLGPAGGTDAYPSLFEKASADGAKVFFSTEESMVVTDTDHRMDVYVRDLETGTTTLVSQGESGCAPACGNGASDAGFAAADADGTEAFFVSEEQLTSEDTDASVDVYVRDLTTETTKLVSAGGASCAPSCGNGAFSASLRGVSTDASHAYFTTAESLSGSDTDSAVDVYSRNLLNDTTSLVSEGGVGCVPACGNSGAVPVFQGSSGDGSRAFFTTDEQLVGADEDTATDIYARDLPAGPTFLISGGNAGTATASFAATSGDGAHVFFTTAEPLVAEDKDEANDVYEWSGGKLGLVSSAACASECGSTFDAVSADSETVVYSTAEQLAGEDTDKSVDVYEQEVGSGAPILVSRGAAGCGGCGNGAADARFNRASSDASHVVFTSTEVLSPKTATGKTTSMGATSPVKKRA